MITDAEALAGLYAAAAVLKVARYGRVFGPVPEGTPCEHCAGAGADEHARYRASLNREPGNSFAASAKVDTSTVPWVQPCIAPVGVSLHSSRTAYCWDGDGEDPNRPVALCPDCAADHHDRWDDMWSNVP